jgi:hypothetical protein
MSAEIPIVYPVHQTGALGVLTLIIDDMACLLVIERVDDLVIPIFFVSIDVAGLTTVSGADVSVMTR